MANKLMKNLKDFARRIVGSEDKQIDGQKTVYGDVIVFNQFGQVLFLQRASDDDFEPGKWCLPGGKVELGEKPIEGAKRELEEETLLSSSNTSQWNSLGKVDRGDNESHYFATTALKESLVGLDNAEHYHYKWMSKEEYLQSDLLLDLKNTLVELDLPTFPIESIEVIQDIDNILFNQVEIVSMYGDGLLTKSQYIELQEGCNQKVMSILSKSFNEDAITADNFVKAIQLSKARSEELENESITALKYLEKADRKCQVGERKEFGGKQYEKIEKGWQLVKEDKV